MFFYKKLKILRESAHLSQKELAEKSNVSQQAISAIEKGIRSPSESTMDMLSDALGFSLVEVLSYEEDTSNSKDVLCYEERELIRCFRAINNDSKKIVLDLITTYSNDPTKQEGHKRNLAI